MYIYNNKSLNYISPIYQTKLNNIKANISHSGNLKTHKNYILIKSVYEKLEITALINPKIHTVTDAKHIGGEEDNKNLFLEYICKSIINKSIQECSDHGAMNIEYTLRDPNKKPNIPGIITLNNIDPIFKTANILLRNLLFDYRVKFNYKSTENFHFPALSNTWKSLNKSERLELVKGI